MAVVPYKENNLGKRQQVEVMFDQIAPRYDFLNRMLSVGIDVIWRKALINTIKKQQPKYILDVATGTGDVAIEIARTLHPQLIIGVDISNQMLEEGRRKIKERNLTDIIELKQGDAEKLEFESDSFDAVTVAFGVRNFENLEKGIAELFRVLKPGATLAVLEFSKPQAFPVKNLFNFYFKYVLPRIGSWISKDSSAYTYLPESVQSFPQGNEFIVILEKIGFKKCKCTSLTFGISSIYTGQKGQ